MILGRLFFLLALLASIVSRETLAGDLAARTAANRLTYLDESDPFYVNLHFPKLTVPQWIGEEGIEAVVVLAIDDMKDHQKYENYLRPILERLKQIDGRAALSVMCNTVDPPQPHLRQWLKEGLSLEVHTLTHPCPLLARSNFVAAANTYHRGVELLNGIPENKPVAFRMPCCDSINSPSPRFYAEIFNRTNAAGQFLSIDSSVMDIFTPHDPSLRREWVLDAEGIEKFRKYLPFPSFVTTIDDYPYPYVIGKLCWEFPAVVPSDWEAQHLHGTNNPVTIADWKAALEATALKQGTYTMIFHPHGWIRNDQIVELLDFAVSKFGNKIKFLNFREAQDRINQHLLAGQALRAPNGQDNGVRLIDINNDGYLDVIISNEIMRRARIWQPQERAWKEIDFPTPLVTVDQEGNRHDTGVKFGVIHPDGYPTIWVRNESNAGAWHFNGSDWVEDRSLCRGLALDGQPIFTSSGNHDRGVRLRDLDNDGRCEFIVGNESQNAVFAWLPEEALWKKLSYSLPEGTSIVTSQGRDNGLRFIDVNEDGYDDVLFSNEQRYSLNLFISVPKSNLGWERGWSFKARSGQRGEPGEIPMIVRGGPTPNNGAWFHSKHLWIQNEETDALADKVDRRSFADLLTGAESAAKSPEQALATIHVRPGFQVELVANEPMVIDPVAFDWGADGKLWVVEMRDYPLGIDGKGKSGGVIRFLEDTDGDGRYDKSTVFLEGVHFPNGIMPWRKGVLVSAAPEIFYAEDTDGDGRADLRTSLLTGFNEGNQQHRVNGFEYGLDNWVYAANGDSGGTIRSALTGQSANLRGHDLRFHPDDGSFQTIAGQTQFGRHRDDWGNWFGNNNSTWLWHYFLPEQYLARNPDLAVSSTRRVLANYPNSNQVFPISRPQQRFNWPEAVNSLTSGNSATPYRDDLFGPDFSTSVFISEPAQSVVHREVLEADGITFASHRASDEQDREFLASSDNWFRPTMLKTGPDGALYIADMYRLVVEHPEYFPEELKKRPDLRAGEDKGRIYRVYPMAVSLPHIPRLDKLSTAQLVAVLESPNGWQRDTAQRLLIQTSDKTAVKHLEKLVAGHKRPKTRLQALCTLDGLGALTMETVLVALKDEHPLVREHAVRLSERLLKNSRGMGEALLRVVEDPSIRVRYQLAFSLGEWDDPRSGVALAKLAMKDSQDSSMQTAVLSSAKPHAAEMLDVLLARAEQQSPPAELLTHLLGLVTAAQNEHSLTRALEQLSKPAAGKYASWQMAAVAGFLDALERQNKELKKFRAQARPQLKQAIGKLDALFQEASRRARDTNSDLSSRLVALRLLGRGPGDQQQDLELLGRLLHPQVDVALQKAAVENLKRTRDPLVAKVFLSEWNGLGPALRSDLLNALSNRQEWIQQLLSAIESGKINAREIGAVYQQKMTSHSNPEIRERAQKLFATKSPDRLGVLKNFANVKSSLGDPDHGAELYRVNCMTCHRLKGEGNNLGPDLGTMSDKPVESLMVAILDPNQAVESRYLNYTAVTKNGREISGIITAETPNSITLNNAGGNHEIVLRSDLQTFSSSGLSLMPEGFESAFTPQDLADVIAYIRINPASR